jgi:hypothetical protein
VLEQQMLLLLLLLLLAVVTSSLLMVVWMPLAIQVQALLLAQALMLVSPALC